MKKATLLILGSTMLLSACQSMINSMVTSTPSAKAAAIIETVYPEDVEKCQSLGTVEGSSMLGANEDGGAISMNNATVEAKEQAAELGATHILYASVKKTSNTSLGGSNVSGKAYKCN
jgi:PBP1b-binding outer membrane lipoprotein LpoB